MNITDFLHARITEDEATARAATKGRWVPGKKRAGKPGYWRGIDAYCVLVEGSSLDLGANELIADLPDEQDAEHIVRHNPTRVLAECAAKRAIVKRETSQYTMDREAMGAQIEYAPDGVAVATPHGERFEGLEADEWLAQHSTRVTDTPTLRILAAVYANHPDYNPAWRIDK